MPVRRHPRRVVTTLVSAAALSIGWAAAGAIPASAVSPAAFDPSSCVTALSNVVPGVHIAGPACELRTGWPMGGERPPAEFEAKKGNFVGDIPPSGVTAGKAFFASSSGPHVTAAGIAGSPFTTPTTLAPGTAYAPAYQTAVQS